MERQGCYRSTPSGEEAKGLRKKEGGDREGFLQAAGVERENSEFSSTLGRGRQGRPSLSKTLLGTMADIPMASATNYTLYSLLATALKPVSSASLLPGLPASSLSSPVHLCTRPQAGLFTHRAVALSGSQPAHGSSTAGRRQALSLAVQAL